MTVVGNGSFGERVRKLRLQKGLTQQQLAAPHYTHAYISTIEAGRRHPSEKALSHLSEKLGVDPEYLITGRPPGLNSRLRLKLELARQAMSDGQTSAANDSIREVLSQAREFQLDRITARALELRAYISEREGEFETAINRYEQAEDVWRANSSPTSCASAVAGQIRCTTYLGDIHHAIYIGEAYLGELTRGKMRSPNAVVRVQSQLIMPYHSAGSHAKAEEAASECLKLSSHVDQPLVLAQLHFTTGIKQLEGGHFDDADASFGKAQELFEELEFREEFGLVHLARGVAFSRAGKLGDARQQLEQASAMFEGTNNRIEWANALMELGRVHRLEGDLSQAASLLERSLEFLGEEGMARYRAWAHRELAQTLVTKDPPISEKNAQRAIELFAQASQPIEVARTELFLCRLMAEQGEPAAVLAHAGAAEAALEALADI